MNKRRECIVEECSNTINPKSRFDICHTCRSGLSYWKRKRPAQVLDRRRKLTMFADRIAMIIKRRDL